MTRPRGRALVLAHDHASPAGPVGERLVARGYDLVHELVVPPERYLSPGVEHDFSAMLEHDVVVLLGSPWSVYDDATVGTWVHPELDQLRAADAAGIPVLGICFGGQLLAQAHGGTVTASDHPEIGFTHVDSDHDDLLPAGPWFQWHYDRFTTPPHATEIARNPAAPQAFVLRRNLAVQFHPEITPAGLEEWCSTGFADDEGVPDLDRLRASVAERDETNSRRAHALVDGFLDRVATAPHPRS